MRKVINHKRYETDRATMVGSWDNGSEYMGLDYYAETMYQKRTGEFFLHLEGGARSPLAESRDGGTIGGEKVRPISEEEARTWAENHLDADEYAAVFGDPEGEESLYLRAISASAKAKLEREAQKTGKTQMQIVEELLEAL